MKYILKILVPILFTIQGFAQVPQTQSVTIAPGTGTTHDVKGNLKVSAVTESSSVKVMGLATGDPFIARPVYANDQGFLVTGYKVGYVSIPPIAFKFHIDINNGDSEYTGLGNDILIFDASSVFAYSTSSNRDLLSPVYLPHKSKLSAIKLTFWSVPNTPRALIVDLFKAPLNDASNATSIFNYTTVASANASVITAEVPINLIEIDNQNFVYTIRLRSSSNSWDLLVLRGVSLEYHDF